MCGSFWRTSHTIGRIGSAQKRTGVSSAPTEHCGLSEAYRGELHSGRRWSISRTMWHEQRAVDIVACCEKEEQRSALSVRHSFSGFVFRVQGCWRIRCHDVQLQLCGAPSEPQVVADGATANIPVGCGSDSGGWEKLCVCVTFETYKEWAFTCK